MMDTSTATAAATDVAVDTSGFLNATVDVPIGVLLLLFLLIILPTGDIISLARAGVTTLKSEVTQDDRAKK